MDSLIAQIGDVKIEFDYANQVAREVKPMERPDGFCDSYRRKPICGVLAVAVCAGVSFDRAHAACKAHMLTFQKRFRGGTYHRQRVNALWALGAKFIEHDVPDMTLEQFVRYKAKPGTLYMVCIRSHVLTVKDGYVQDQGWLCPISQFGGRKRAKLEKGDKKIVEIVA